MHPFAPPHPPLSLSLTPDWRLEIRNGPSWRPPLSYPPLLPPPAPRTFRTENRRDQWAAADCRGERLDTAVSQSCLHGGSHAIWTSRFVTVCVIRNLFIPTADCLGDYSVFCVEIESPKGAGEESRGEARWVGGSDECLSTPKWLSRSAKGPIRGTGALRIRSGINNSSLPQHANRRESCEGFAENPLRREAGNLTLLRWWWWWWSAELNILFAPFSWPLQPHNKLCHPPLWSFSCWLLFSPHTHTYLPVSLRLQFSVLSAAGTDYLFVKTSTGRVTL